MRWSIRRCRANTDLMSKELGISKIFANVLSNRGIMTKDEAINYINPKFKQLHNMSDMKDSINAIKIVVDAVNKNEKIVIYGDYDVDGVTSTVILYKALKSYGADIYYYIPDRAKEGYGLNKDTISKLHNIGYNLIFACDNGIAAIEEVKFIKELGMRIIVLDHHEPAFLEADGIRKDIIPNSDALIDPKQEGCNYKFKQLCAAGLSYKFANLFFKYVNIKYEYELELFIFAMIATICDVVDLLDENRTIVKIGLKYINRKEKITNKGLKALIKYNGIEDKVINEYTIGFIIGPCINAAGRLESAKLAVDLFITDDDRKAFKLAQKLSELNETRKTLTKNASEKIIYEVENSNIINDKVLVIYDDSIHESIIGIVAGRVREKFYKPVIVITKGEKFAKGSARSIKQYNIFEELLKCKHLFIKFGGHSMAAGLSIKEENIEILRKLLNKNCSLNENDMQMNIRIDRVLNFSDIDFNIAREIEKMQPIGKANEEAIFATKGVIIDRVKFVGKNNDILQFNFVDNINNIAFRGISFDLYEKFKTFIYDKLPSEKCNEILEGINNYINLKVDIVYSISINEYNGNKSIQLNIIDFRDC